VAWSLLNPLVQLLVLGLVFAYIVPLGIPNYAAFLFIGLLTWSWLQSSLYAAATAIIEGRNLIKRPGFPAAILPIVTVSANLIHFLLALPVLFLFLVFVGIEFAPASLILPVIIVLQFAFTLGLAYFIATFHVTFRDTQHLVGVFLLLAFYLTPIFYDTSLVPERFQSLFRLNPILHLLDAYRAVLLYGELPNFASLTLLAVLSAGLIFFGYRVFLRTSYRFIEEL
jgi:lipopolysaccharide transport system permease protein